MDCFYKVAKMLLFENRNAVYVTYMSTGSAEKLYLQSMRFVILESTVLNGAAAVSIHYI